MKYRLNPKKKATILYGALLAVIFAQGIFIAKLFSEKDHRTYEVNLVPIKTDKDSIDFQKMRNDLGMVDQTVRTLSSFLASKNITSEKISALAKDSLENTVYLSRQSNRYSQYLVDLQNKLQEVPLGMPTDGYISSNFGKRKNPIPFKTVMLASVTGTSRGKVQAPKPIEEKDSLGKVVTATPGAATPTAEKNNPPAEADQMQFHKGLDIAVAYGTDVRAAAKGTVIFAGPKGGYGNCVIVSHGNGLDTLYGHLSQILVKANDAIQVGDVIAKSGNTGRSTGPHLHYEVHRNNTPVNPKLFMTL